MYESRAAGTAKNIGGKIGDPKIRAEGVANRAKGQDREEETEIADAIKETASVARRALSSFGSSLRNAIETQPYTTALVAFGLGWLWGRMHRPL